jgi:hypothetical protein
MTRKVSIVSAVLVPLLACGSDDTVKPVDSRIFQDGSGGGTCTAQAMYAALGTMGLAKDYPEHMGSAQVFAHQQIMIETLGSNDAVYLELNAGFGGFGSNDIQPGTYQFAGEDLDYSTCGVCFLLFPMSVTGTSFMGDINNVYVATAGTIVLTDAGGSAGSGSGHMVAGSITNVTFKKATIDADRMMTYDPANCTTSIGSGGFGYNLQLGSAAAARSDSNNELVNVGPAMPRLSHRRR